MMRQGSAKIVGIIVLHSPSRPPPLNKEQVCTQRRSTLHMLFSREMQYDYDKFVSL
jgi:hypothetical protein